MIQAVLDGIGYAMECINITQFFYEEGIQVSILAVGTAVTMQEWDIAEEALNGPLASGISGLWSFGVMYGCLIPSVWMAFTRYWFIMGHYATNYAGAISAGKRAAEQGATSQDARDWGNACIKDIGTIATVLGNPNDHWDAWAKSDACQKWFNTFTNAKGKVMGENFMKALNNYFLSYSSQDKIAVLKYFRILYSDITNNRIKTYKGQPSNLTSLKVTTGEKRNTASQLWSGYNRLQKLAFRNLPGGSVANGYDVFYKLLWKDNINHTSDIGYPGYAFIQIGIGPRGEQRVYPLSDDKHNYKLNQKPTIINSYNFKKGTGSLDPYFLTDLQRGRIYVFKDVAGTVTASYICGQITKEFELIADSPKGGQMIQMINFPIRWGTLYLKIDGKYVDQLVIQPLYSLLDPRIPETYTGGGEFTFRTYNPLEGATMKITDETGEIVLFQETTKDDGLFRIGLTQRYENLTITITHKDYGTFQKKGLKMEQICNDGYLNILNMVGWE